MHSTRGSTISTPRASEQCIHQQSSVQSMFTSKSLHQQQYSTAFTHNSTSINTSCSMVTTQQQQQHQHVSSTHSFDTFETLNMSGGYGSMNNELKNLVQGSINGVLREGDDEPPVLPIKTRLQKDVFFRYIHNKIHTQNNANNELLCLQFSAATQQAPEPM